MVESKGLECIFPDFVEKFFGSFSFRALSGPCRGPHFVVMMSHGVDPKVPEKKKRQENFRVFCDIHRGAPPK